MEADKNVIQLVGNGYSGTSLFSLLLDSIDGVRSVGELFWKTNGGVRPFLPDLSCVLQCADWCPFYDGVESHFYAHTFERYPDAHTLVDASKDWGHMKSMAAAEPDYRYLRVCLTKLPHEWLYSSLIHREIATDDVAVSMARLKLWFEVNRMQMGGAVVRIAYRDFVTRPQFWLSHCMALLDHTEITRRANWWETNSHIFGGNYSVKRQVENNTAYFDEGNKYQGRFHTLFVDDAWRKDAAFVQMMKGIYAREWDNFGNLLKQVGIFDMDWLSSDLKA